jgi:ATP-dependent Clp endopeptidase proteolytic subunit ClpP
MSTTTEDAKLAAEVAKLEAEAAYLVAQTTEAKARAKEATARARKASAEAKSAELQAQVHGYATEYATAQQLRELASDDQHRVYRFNGPVGPDSVRKASSKLTEWSRQDPGCDVEVIFNSPGGYIFDGMALFDLIQGLRAEGHHVTTGSMGYAASMAGILLQAGDVRWIGHQSWLMIHRAAFGAQGKTFEVEDEVEFTKRIEGRIVDIFTSRSNLSQAKLKKAWDRKDWWISADEALTLGLVDEVRGVLPGHISAPKERGA